MNGDMDEILNIFFDECNELLPELEKGLTSLTEGDQSKDTINAVFRAVHSIKGGAASFGLNKLVEFAHKYESALDKLRSGDLEADEKVISIFLTAMDVLSDLVADAKDDTELVEQDRIDKNMDSLEQLISSSGEAENEEPVIEFTPVKVNFDDLDSQIPDDEVQDGPADGYETHIIDFKPHAALYKNGDDAYNILSELKRHSVDKDKFHVTCLNESLQSFDSMSVDTPSLKWRIELPKSDITKEQILEIFDWVIDICDLEITEGVSSDVTADNLAEDKVTEDNNEPKDALENAIHQETKTPESDEKPEPTPPKERLKSKAKKKDSGSIRIDVERLNNLMDMVGEMVIAQASVESLMTVPSKTNHSNEDNQELSKRLYTTKGLTRDIQSLVMSMRAQPIGNVFQRMQRVVREASQVSGKQIHLIVKGEDTEVDRSFIESLAEPLTHMLRNAIDHGIESPEDRKAAHKDITGTIELSAQHRSGHIVIEISDDGRGIDKKRVYQKALDKGIISPKANLNSEQINELVFEPGFSTADKVSDLSGRGVGMDVVKNAIHDLGGRVSIKSSEGKGTKFLLSLPLTMAVLDGMLIQTCGSIMVVPVSSVVEMTTVEKTDIYQMPDNSDVVSIREQSIPLIYLERVLELQDCHRKHDASFVSRHESFNEIVLLIVEDESGAKAALVVDGVKDQTQVVIKSIETNYRHIDGVSAATILGDGSVSLILDISSIVSKATKKLNTKILEK